MLYINIEAKPEAKIHSLNKTFVKKKPKIKGVINEIYQKLGLDYFGIDSYYHQYESIGFRDQCQYECSLHY